MRGLLRRGFVAIAAVGLLVVFHANTALADHFEFRADDPDLQVALTPYETENHVYRFWHSGADVWWAVDSASTDIRDDALTIIANGEAAVPELPFTETSIEVDLEIGWGFCSSSAAVNGCMKTDLITWEFNSTHDAAYLKTAKIWLNNGAEITWTTDLKREALAHELGHFYGLHERYVASDPDHYFECNPDSEEISVMESLGCDDRKQGPQQIDVDRVRACWSQGTMAWLTPEFDGAAITWKWNDEGWSEKYQQFNAFQWDGAYWIQYVQWYPYVAGIGVHKDSESRQLSKVTTAPALNVAHLACGHPYFAAFDTYGTWQCSQVFVGGTDLVAFWKLDETSGSWAYDFTTNDNDTTVENGAQWVTGRVNNALHFDGINDDAWAPNSSSLQVSTLTVAAWVKIDDQDEDYQTIASKRNWIWDWDLLLDTQANNKFLCCVANDVPVTTCVPGAGALSYGQWYHVAGTFNGDTFELFVNGVSQGTAGFSGTRPSSISNTTIGMMLQNANDMRHFEGTIDEVKIYDRALTANEVAALYYSY